jgi:hypothetical protein
MRLGTKKDEEAQKPKTPVNNMDNNSSDIDDYLSSLEINKVGNKDNVIWATPAIEGTPLKQELHMRRVSVSVISYQQSGAKL